jgi:hypothetical protein
MTANSDSDFDLDLNRYLAHVAKLKADGALTASHFEPIQPITSPRTPERVAEEYIAAVREAGINYTL